MSGAAAARMPDQVAPVAEAPSKDAIPVVAAVAGPIAVAGLTGAFTVRRLAPGTDPLGGSAVPDDVAGELAASRGRGNPVPEHLATTIGESLGANLSGVRLHTDSKADRLARSVQSVAFTQGSDVYFTRGAYAPDTTSGQHLLAHELTHVAQAQRPGGSGGGSVIGRADDPTEVEADKSAHAVVDALRRTMKPKPAPATETATGGTSGDALRRTIRRNKLATLAGPAPAEDHVYDVIAGSDVEGGKHTYDVVGPAGPAGPVPAGGAHEYDQLADVRFASPAPAAAADHVYDEVGAGPAEAPHVYDEVAPHGAGLAGAPHVYDEVAPHGAGLAGAPHVYDEVAPQRPGPAKTRGAGGYASALSPDRPATTSRAPAKAQSAGGYASALRPDRQAPAPSVPANHYAPYLSKEDRRGPAAAAPKPAGSYASALSPDSPRSARPAAAAAAASAPAASGPAGPASHYVPYAGSGAGSSPASSVPPAPAPVPAPSAGPDPSASGPAPSGGEAGGLSGPAAIEAVADVLVGPEAALPAKRALRAWTMAQLGKMYENERTVPRPNLVDALTSVAAAIKSLYNCKVEVEQGVHPVVAAQKHLGASHVKVATANPAGFGKHLDAQLAGMKEFAKRQDVPVDDQGNLGDVSKRVVEYDETPESQAASLVTVGGGMLHRASGEAVDTKDSSTWQSKLGVEIFVVGAGGDIHMGSHKIGKYHHSSLLAGADVAVGGEMKVTAGKIIWMSNKSGHYSPTMEQLVQFLAFLEEDGVALEDFRIMDFKGVPSATAREVLDNSRKKK